jgi:hypothetical protein
MLAFAFLISFIGAIWSANIASRKNLNVLAYAVLGFLVPLIGLLIVFAAEPAEATS